MVNHVEKAEKLFLSGCNCSQSVFAAFDDIVGMSREKMLDLASGFGGGMAGMRDTCGTVCGMFMVIGAVYGNYDVRDTAAKSAYYKELQQLTSRFHEKCGSTNCRELLGLVKGINPPPSERSEE
ncbi:MAG: C-GCAxxG-C-C family protein, partial [Clostridia bacterium]|nr:C-GCAxxG-C-C family protein [Clostridia bacterium]